MINKFKQLNRGVSPAVGTLLLLAVTVILATVIAVFVFNISLSSPVTAGVEIQEKGNNSAEVMWKDSGNADELLVKINGVNQSTLSGVSDSTSFSYNNGDTVSVVGVTEDNTSVITSEKFGFETVADETNTPSNKLLASSKEDADGVLLIAGDISSESETDIQFKLDNEPVNADGTWTYDSAKYFKFYINNYEGDKDYVFSAEPIGDKSYKQYIFKSSYLSSLNDSSGFSDLDKDFVVGSINQDYESINVLSIQNNKELFKLTVDENYLSVDNSRVGVSPQDTNKNAVTIYEDQIILENDSETVLEFYIDPSTVKVEENEVFDFQSGGRSIVGESNSTSIEPGKSVSFTLEIDLTNSDTDALRNTTVTPVVK